MVSLWAYGLVRASLGGQSASSEERIRKASSRQSPQKSRSALKPLHTAGRSGELKMAQRKSSVRFTQRTPAGLPLGMPGIGELMEGAMQQAPQPARQSKNWSGEGSSFILS